MDQATEGMPRTVQKGRRNCGYKSRPGARGGMPETIQSVEAEKRRREQRREGRRRKEGREEEGTEEGRSGEEGE